MHARCAICCSNRAGASPISSSCTAKSSLYIGVLLRTHVRTNLLCLDGILVLARLEIQVRQHRAHHPTLERLWQSEIMLMFLTMAVWARHTAKIRSVLLMIKQGRDCEIGKNCIAHTLSRTIYWLVIARRQRTATQCPKFSVSPLTTLYRIAT
jgi:hypothetical protein